MLVKTCKAPRTVLANVRKRMVSFYLQKYGNESDERDCVPRVKEVCCGGRDVQATLPPKLRRWASHVPASMAESLHCLALFWL